MTNPIQIVLDVKYDADGILDTMSLINQIESALENRILFGGWVDERQIADEFPHLSAEDRRALISNIESGDYDESIDKDLVMDVITEAAEKAEIELFPEPDDEDSEDEDETADISP